MTTPMATRLVAQANADCPWDEFDPEAYVTHNYLQLRDDDRKILGLVQDFFSSTVTRPVDCGIDVGSGANLYPTLAMLPFCKEITLLERGRANVAWLNNEVGKFSPLWDPYWEVLAAKPRYADVDARDAVREKAIVKWADLYKLRRRPRWDMGTMFFVAESISNQEREFKLAVEKFVGALKPGAPFAAAFMQESLGYYVGRVRFPAVAINKTDVQHCLERLVDIEELASVPSKSPLRDGYGGMILALGRAGKAKG
jgi:NNMT/PNMT/TEMT family